MSIKVEARYPHRDELGEGPHWDAATNTLLRVDTLLGQVHRLEPMTGDQTTLQLDSPLGFAVSSGSGSVTVGIGHSVQRVDPDGTGVRSPALRRTMKTFDSTTASATVTAVCFSGRCPSRANRPAACTG